MRDRSEPQAAEQGQPRGVQQRDAGALFAMLLLFHTQRCEPRVQVYVPLGVYPAPPCVLSCLALRRRARLQASGSV